MNLENSFALMTMDVGSMSKCVSPDTQVRMANGSLKRAADVFVGDTLCGDDAGVRTVLTTTNGRAEMVEVQPGGTESFQCNGDHILSLVCTWTRQNHGGRYGISSGY